MRTSEKTNDVFKALCNAQREIKNPAFNKNNPYFKCKYADLPEVISCVKVILADNGLCVSQSPMMHEGQWVLVTKLMHESGQWIDGMVPLVFEAGKNPMQALGSAITYARRYALAALCNISADDDDDGNSCAQRELKPKHEDGSATTLELNKLKSLISQTGKSSGTVQKWLDKANVARIEDLPRDAALKITAHLENQANKDIDKLKGGRDEV
jgi:hypothetical protein